MYSLSVKCPYHADRRDWFCQQMIMFLLFTVHSTTGKNRESWLDYVIVMGCDEHFAGGDAGSVASISYVENGITGTLKEVPKEKLINSVPFYTRVWTEKDGKTTSKAYGMTAAKKWVDEIMQN